MLHYTEPLYRPPAEANSLILQVALGCPNNTCTFCGMYKARKYKERPLKDVFQEIERAGMQYPFVKRVFLADGDVMYMEYGKLVHILEKLNVTFPHLARVNLYANSSSIINKSRKEIEGLRALKLHTAYLGLESGSNKVLKNLKKIDCAEDAVQAAALARKCGLKLSVMLLIGAGGIMHSPDHIRESVRVLNEMEPPILSMLTMIPVPGTDLFRKIEKGEFIPLNKEAVLLELKSIISGLNLERTVFRCNHTSNPLPLEGRLPKDRKRLIGEIDEILKNEDFWGETVWTSPFLL